MEKPCLIEGTWKALSLFGGWGMRPARRVRVNVTGICSKITCASPIATSTTSKLRRSQILWTASPLINLVKVAEEETTTRFFPLSNNITALVPRWLLPPLMALVPNAGGDPIDHNRCTILVTLTFFGEPPPAFNLDMNSWTITPWTNHY